MLTMEELRQLDARYEQCQRDLCRLLDGRMRSDQSASVTVVAVSKGHPFEAVVRLHRQHGHRDFGESYVQELEGKMGMLRDLQRAGGAFSVRWHFIGRLRRSNASRFGRLIGQSEDERVGGGGDGGGAVVCWHSVDDVRVARMVHRRLLRPRMIMDN